MFPVPTLRLTRPPYRRATRLALATLLAGAVSPAAAQTPPSVTIYPGNRVLVRTVAAVRIPRGDSEVRLELDRIDPGSLVPLDAGVRFRGWRYDASDNDIGLLMRAVGRTLRVVSHDRTDTLGLTVEVARPLRLRAEDGTIHRSPPGRVLWPPDLEPGAATVVVGVRAVRAVDSLRFAYLTAGVGWSARYAIDLDGDSATVAGRALLTAGDFLAKGAEVQLLAGNVSASAPGVRNFGYALDELTVAGSYAATAAPVPTATEEQSTGDVHTYLLNTPVDVLPFTSTAVDLFDPATVPIVRRYRAGEGREWPTDASGETPLPVHVRYVIERGPESPMARLPLPAGVVQLFRRDAGGRVYLAGESRIRHIAPGEPVIVHGGDAFDLTARRTVTSSVHVNGAWEAEVTVTVANARDTLALVEVVERRARQLDILSATVPARRVAHNEFRFEVRAPAGGEGTVSYRVRFR